ncbi:hypothetical protein B0T10DRAFT_492076 [Thelonectria olida]|uniref:SET domain-containing protein n=1 Tax=Thelonectria olida TaxID=1576542 RepID=A0A9P9AM92_9HYPO|nr:hypothetical protein B0T10DRAFT_492076 [Thelonectria olida]
MPTTTNSIPSMSLQLTPQVRMHLETTEHNAMHNLEAQTPSFWPSPDSIDTEYACTSESESSSCSYSEPWSEDDDNEDDDDNDEFVLCLTSRGARPLEPTSSLCPSLPRRFSFMPLEATEQTEESMPLTEPPPKDQQIQDFEPSPKTILFQNDYFAVYESTIAGWGAFAARDLKHGDKILVEQPLFIANSLSLFSEFEKLDEKARELALGLHANEMCKPGTPKLQAIWMANCFSTGVRDLAGLFVVASRFNHSCRPGDNVEYTFSDDSHSLEMIVKATTITAGQELTISYGTKRTPLDLYFRYGFRCRCGTCPGLPDDEEVDIW